MLTNKAEHDIIISEREMKTTSEGGTKQWQQENRQELFIEHTRKANYQT